MLSSNYALNLHVFNSTSGTPHAFYLAELMEKALEADEIVCPVCKRCVLLELLAPDSVIGDLESRYKVAPSEFVLDEM